MSLKDSWQVRAVALASLAYSTTIAVAPKVLAQPCGLTRHGTVPDDAAGLIRSTGVRDAVLAAALALAPAGRVMSGLSLARVISDGADTVWFSSFVPRSQRVKVAGTAGAWALVELVVEAAFNRAGHASG